MAAEVRGIRPFAFRLAVAVNPIDSPLLNRRSVSRFFRIARYLQVLLLRLLTIFEIYCSVLKKHIAVNQEFIVFVLKEHLVLARSAL